ncbi:MAG: hypothetical protein JST86_16400 [Bacteroidetes bacterium]|nr:hypothetical protein [Bacteroidota bacterium]
MYCQLAGVPYWMQKTKRIVLIASLSIFSCKCFSQLVLKNKLLVPIEVCIGWNQDIGKWRGYETKGWFTIYPGQTIRPGLTFTSNHDFFLYYARTTTGVFNEVTKGITLLVNPTSSFDIKNADTENPKKQNPNYQWKAFKTRRVSFKKGQKRKYIFEITILNIISNT